MNKYTNRSESDAEYDRFYFFIENMLLFMFFDTIQIYRSCVSKNKLE